MSSLISKSSIVSIPLQLEQNSYMELMKIHFKYDSMLIDINRERSFFLCIEFINQNQNFDSMRNGHSIKKLAM